MSYKIRHLCFRCFRSFEYFDDEPSQNLNIILGANAVGKTNLIEGIQLISMLESFRNPAWGDVVHWGHDRAHLIAEIQDGLRNDEIMVCFEDGKRFYLHNEKRKRAGELKGLIPAVLFTPDDLELVKGSASKRRRAIDQIGAQISQTYYHMQRDYEKVVLQRNRLLKRNDIADEFLLSWTESLISIGSVFSMHRQNLFGRMKERFSEVFSRLSSKDSADIEYLPYWKKYISHSDTPEQTMRELLQSISLQERDQGTTLVGPHRDEIVFLINGKDARRYGSQGQQRSLVLAWKITELEVMEDILNKVPLLLLDDVMSELDENRRISLLTLLRNHDIQTFITSANDAYFDKALLDTAHVVRLP